MSHTLLCREKFDFVLYDDETRQTLNNNLGSLKEKLLKISVKFYEIY